MSTLVLKFLPDEIQRSLPPEISRSIAAQIRLHVSNDVLKVLAKESNHSKLQEIPSQLTPEYVSEKYAMDRYHMSASWFRNHRWQGTGPPFRKFGSAVRYRLDDLEDYFAATINRT